MAKENNNNNNNKAAATATKATLKSQKIRKKKRIKITKYSICALYTQTSEESKTRNELNIIFSFAGSGTKSKCTHI